MIMVQQVPKRWNFSLNLAGYVPQLSTPLWFLSATMIDIDTHRRKIGGFNNNRHWIEKRKKNRQRKRSRLKTIYPLHTVVFVTAITVCVFSTTLWLPQDSPSGKNRQRGSTFKSLDFISDNEKTHFNRLRTLHSQLIRAKSHLYFFEKCLEQWVYPENLNVRDHFQAAFNTPKFKKAYSNLNKNTRNEKINLSISHYKLLSGKISEDIAEQKLRLTRFSMDERLKILTEKLTIFSKQLSKRLSKTKEFELKKLLKEIPISPPESAHTNNTWSKI